MIESSYFFFVLNFLLVAMRKSVNSTETYFHLVENRVTTTEGLSFSSESIINCAFISGKENSCSAKFSENDKLCILTPSENCFDELVQATGEGWVTMMNIPNKQLFTTNKTWNDAQAFCMSSGGRLARVRNSYEHDAIVAMIKDQKILNRLVWIGGTDIQQEGVFVWEGTSDKVIRGSKFWNPGQPDSASGAEDCLSYRDLKETGVFKWNDSDCQNTAAFICEFNSFFK